MKINEIISETTAGAVATVAVPLGGMRKRPNPSIFSNKKNKKLKDGRIGDTFGTNTIDKHDKPQKKKSKDKVDESNPRREKAVKQLVDIVKARGLSQFRNYQGAIDRDNVESFMARNMPDDYRGRDTGKAIEDAMAELESALSEQVPYLQRPNSGYRKAVKDFLRLNPGKSEDDFKSLLPNQQEKYLNKYYEGKKKTKESTLNEYKYYIVKGPKGFKEKILAGSEEDAKTKARHLAYRQGKASVGASRFSGTSDSDFEIGEGKSPHKKGTKKYKKHMAAMHAG